MCALGSTVPKDERKSTALAVLMGSSVPKAWTDQGFCAAFLGKFVAERDLVCEIIAQKRPTLWAKICADIEAKKLQNNGAKISNPFGTLLSVVLGDLENCALATARAVLLENGFMLPDFGGDIYDGTLIKKDKEDDVVELLPKIETRITKVLGFKITLVAKKLAT
eukprot:g12439.t1